jgi:hypothetical protein
MLRLKKPSPRNLRSNVVVFVDGANFFGVAHTVDWVEKKLLVDLLGIVVCGSMAMEFVTVPIKSIYVVCQKRYLKKICKDCRFKMRCLTL